jgi:hypothetical protein
MVVCGIALTLVLMASQAGISAAIGVTHSHAEQYVFEYDLGALSKDDHRNLFPQSVVPRSRFALLQQDFSPDDVVAITFVPNAPISAPLSKSAEEALRKSWIKEVENHPFSYLGMRWTLFLRQIGVTRRPIWVYQPGIDANTFGYRTRFPTLDNAAGDYVKAFAEPNLDGTAVHLPWIYLIIAILGVGLLLRRSRGPAVMAVGGLALTALTLQVGYFFGAMGVQYRFEHPAVVCALIALAVMVKLAVDRLAARRRDRVATT